MSAKKTISSLPLLIIGILCFGCERSILVNGGEGRLPPGTWQFLGFDDKVANSFSISEPYLYVAALEDGVWRRNIKRSSADWEYLGLVSRDSTKGTYRGSVVRVDAWGNDILAGLLPPIELEPGIRIGVWQSIDCGTTWTPSDSGMRAPTWQWSGVHDIRRSPKNSAVVMAGYGAYYKSSDKQYIISLAYDEPRNIFYIGALDGVFRLKDPLSAPRVPYQLI
jgi:hypothetical protein